MSQFVVWIPSCTLIGKEGMGWEGVSSLDLMFLYILK